ncbi:MAG: AAA family ATPase [archaeon]
MIWYRKLSFKNNPFSVKPAAFQPDMVAYDLDYIYQKIDNAEILFIEGEYGTGKTTILKNLISRYKGKNRIIYYSFNDSSAFNLKSLVDGANSLLGRIAGIKVRNILLFLDEVHTMSKKEASDILKFYESGTLKSVVMVSHDIEAVTIPEEMKMYLKDNVIKTATLNLSEAEELIKSRIGDIGLFPSPIIKRIFSLSGRNPRKFLSYCEDVARYAIEMDDYKVVDFHVDTVLADEMKKENKRSVPVTKIEKPKERKIKEKVLTKEKAPMMEVEIPEKPKIEKKIKISEPKEERIVIESIKEVLKEPTMAAPVMFEAKEEIKILDLSHDKEDSDDAKRQKKYKVNKLVEGTKDPLGTIEAKEEESKKLREEEIPEYKVFVFDN